MKRSKDKIKKTLGENDHAWMTYAAVSVLSREDREYLEPESELFIRVYSGFPDMTGNCYGEWGGWSGYPNDPRLADARREWDVAYYIGWDTRLKQHTWPKKGLCDDWPEGRMYLHSIPDSYGACRLYFTKAVEAFREGKHADGVRFLGILAHYVEDPVTFSDMQSIHRQDIDGYKYIEIGDYRPRLLARNMKEAADCAVTRLRETVCLVRQKGLDARRAIRGNDRNRLRDIVAESDGEGAKVLADIVHTAIFLGGAKQRWKANPTGVNLVNNPSFETAEDDETPSGWFVHYDNLHDHVGAAFYEGRILRNCCVVHSGIRSVKLTWTPREGMEWRQRWRSAIQVVPGEKYRASVWMKTVEATGHNAMVIHFYKRNNDLVKTFQSKGLTGAYEWTRCALDMTVPNGAEKARIGLRSSGNRGAVWFDEVDLTRIGGREKVSISMSQGSTGTQTTEDLVLSLSFEQKPSVDISSIKDDSIHGTEHTGANFPIISCSGGEIVDLHVSNGKVGKCLEFDGQDDFVEIAYSRIQDVLNPVNELTIAFWMKAKCHKDACLVSKESLLDGKREGYRMDITRDGRLRFFISAGGDYSAPLCATYAANRWVHAAATVDRQGVRRLYVDGVFRAKAKDGSRLTPAKDKDFYMGADTGIDKFYCGLLDEVRIYRRALDEKAIGQLIR